MATRFDAYRMQDGKTPLSADFFNPVFQDIDLRISDLEQRRTDLQSVIDELSKFGLQRIDALTSRAMEDMTTILAELREVRQELMDGTQLAAAIGAEQAARTEAIAEAVQSEALARAIAIAQEAVARGEAIAEEATARTQAIAAEVAARDAAIAQETDARNEALARVTAKPSAGAIVYDPSGRVSSTTETLPEGLRVTALTYGVGDRVESTATTFEGITKTTTFTYDGQGRVDGYTVAGG